jgi:hypothetical protein
MIAAGAAVSPEMVRSYAAAFEAAGCDEIIFVPPGPASTRSPCSPRRSPSPAGFGRNRHERTPDYSRRPLSLYYGNYAERSVDMVLISWWITSLTCG